ncbi:MAG: pantetheine-phosphate adenylyltransferase [Phycisphaerae bacterium]|nr:pantetheine-phosphate adenylyltransferase [Phycisphaerae bacterium]NUQ46317.1 pantetheine-phosphate adenylyltransferase [Phycisphaerae bacterium]
MGKQRLGPNIAVFPGTFDPPTNGHIDIIQRGRLLFDELIVAVLQNPEKEPLFTTEDRLEMLRELFHDMPNVKVAAFDGLTMDFARKCGARAILRGIRDGADLRFEMQLANANLMVGEVETVFLLANDEYILTSSTLIKQIVEMGGWDKRRLLRLVPPNVAARLRERLVRNGRRARNAGATKR